MAQSAKEVQQFMDNLHAGEDAIKAQNKRARILEIRCTSDIALPGMTVTSIDVTDERFKRIGLSLSLHRAGIYISAKDFWAIIPYSAVKFIKLSGPDEP